MPSKNNNDEIEDINGGAEESGATEEVTTESKADAPENDAENSDAPSAEESPKQAASGEAEPTIIDSVIDTVVSAVETVAENVVEGVSTIVSAVTGSTETAKKELHSKRAEKIGMVSSDKMTKTVVVRVDRVVKHPMYRKYIKRRKKFMAHDELGSAIGDKVRIVETRPLSAKKRWRVIEIIQKAEK